VAKKKVTAAAASVSSTEAFPMARLALQLEVPTAVASIPGRKVGEECWNSGLDDRLEAVAVSIQLEVAVAATSKAAWLRETLPTTSRVLDLYENTITWKFDSRMSKNLNSKLKNEESYTYDMSKHGVKGLTGALGRGPYRERHMDCIDYVNHLLSNWIGQIEHIWDSNVQYP
jgi:hypothetical protein